MKLTLGRRLAPACVLAGAAVVALVAPGAASALNEQCSGEAIHGEGSSLQGLANTSVWGPGFVGAAKTVTTACSGTQGAKGTPAISYTAIASAVGMEAWGLNGHATEYAKDAWAGTDEPPNSAQLTEMKHGTAGNILSIPVLQAAVTVIVHLPTGCTAKSTADAGRLTFGDKQLFGLWSGSLTKWNQITEGGSKVECATKAEEEMTIKRVVRGDGSGTTAIFMKFLSQIKNKKLVFNPSGKKKTFGQEGEENTNTEWPGTNLIQGPNTASGGKLATEVAATESSIGYAGLADARGHEAPATSTVFWALLARGKGKKHTLLTADPASNGDVAAKGTANCENTHYVNGHGATFPPKSTTEPWNAVTTTTAAENYPLCGFTYDLSPEKAKELEGAEFKEGKVQTLHDYLTFALSREVGAGRELLKKESDFLPLPTSSVPTENVQLIAEEGVAKIDF
jgi:ABC-type phosphate transport system substrate-binding protein